MAYRRIHLRLVGDRDLQTLAYVYFRKEMVLSLWTPGAVRSISARMREVLRQGVSKMLPKSSCLRRLPLRSAISMDQCSSACTLEYFCLVSRMTHHYKLPLTISLRPIDRVAIPGGPGHHRQGFRQNHKAPVQECKRPPVHQVRLHTR